MGIRIHKVLGYGLTDVKTEEHRIVDPRINPNSKLLHARWETKAEEYVAWLKTKAAAELERAKAGVRARHVSFDMHTEVDTRESMSKTLAHDVEYGMPNVLALTPLMCNDWHRYDDAIDYVEETYLREPPQGNHVEVLERGIYPFTGSYMDARTGKRLSDTVMTWQRLKNSDTPMLSPEERNKALDAVSRSLGYKDHRQALKRIVPTVPEEIRQLAEWGELFTSDDVWKQLRPILYTYWS